MKLKFIKMDPFEYLPYDKMVEICESLDDKSLSLLVSTSKTAYATCQNIMNQRKEEQNKILQEIISKAPEYQIVYNISYEGTKHLVPDPVDEFMLSVAIGAVPDYVLIPELKLAGNPKNIRSYLLDKGLKPSIVNRLMLTATRNIPNQ